MDCERAAIFMHGGWPVAWIESGCRKPPQATWWEIFPIGSSACWWAEACGWVFGSGRVSVMAEGQPVAGVAQLQAALVEWPVQPII